MGANDTAAIQNRQNNTQLSDAQIEFQRKKKALAEEHEHTLEELRETYGQREMQLRDQSEAIINHIQDETRQKVAELKGNEDNKIGNEKTSAKERYEDLRKNLAMRAQSLEQSSKQQDARYKSEIETSHEREKAALDQASARDEKFLEEQTQRRQKLEKQVVHDIDATKERANEERAKIQNQQAGQIHQIEESQRTQVTKAREAYRKIMDDEKTRRDNEIKVAGEHDEKVIQAKREDYGKRLGALDKYFKESVSHEQTDGDRKLLQLKTGNEKKLNEEIGKGEATQARVHEQYITEYQKAHLEGEKKVNEQKQFYDTADKKLEDEYTKKLDTEKQEFEAKQLDERKRYEMTMTRDKGIYEKNLQNQNQVYQKNFQKNEGQNLTSLRDQKHRLEREMANQKVTYLHQMGKFQERADDPFYQINDLNTRIHENSNHYVIEAHVPPHEKDNVKVAVHDDRVVISGNREFKDGLKTEDGSFRTQTSQSFHEEHKLDFPVAENAAVRHYQDGVLTIIIPKRGSAEAGPLTV